MNYNFMFSEFLEMRRTATLKNREEVAALCGISPQELACYESGEADPSAEILPLLAQALEINPVLFQRIHASGQVTPANFKKVRAGDRKRNLELAGSFQGSTDSAIRVGCRLPSPAGNQPGLQC